MKVLITGVCGFVGSVIAQRLKSSVDGIQLVGLDNFVRRGSELNRDAALQVCDSFSHIDLRVAADLESLPRVDWVIDCAALPSVLAGTAGHASAQQLVDHNLGGTLNLLEYCRRCDAGLVLLSTSRVYSIAALSNLPLRKASDRYDLDTSAELPPGISAAGIGEPFSTASPVSLYGASKLASETMALEYGAAFDFPVRINRCGVLAGAGQFGRADQGIFSFWVHSHLAKRSLRYIGGGGKGMQVRDCLHPIDVCDLIIKQVRSGGDLSKPVVVNVSGGIESSMSLAQLTQWCDDRFGKHPVNASDEIRAYDLPWIVLDSATARQVWNWTPTRSTAMILDEIADFASDHPHWLEISS